MTSRIHVMVKQRGRMRTREIAQEVGLSTTHVSSLLIVAIKNGWGFRQVVVGRGGPDDKSSTWEAS